MAHVQGQQRRGVTNPQPPPCRRLRPRGRQRGPHQHHQWLLSILTIFQLLGIAIGGQVIGGSSSTSSSSSSSSTQSPVKDSSTWRRMGLSESVTNNERELINKILRDDTPSAATSFPYALPPAAVGTSSSLMLLLPATVTEATTAAETGAVAVNGKINQSRSKEEQEAFNKQLHLQRRRRRAVNVVVNTIFTSSERRRRRSSSSSELENSNFLLKSIVTDIDKYCGVKGERNKCTRDKFHRRLSTKDIPQMMKLGEGSSQQEQLQFANVTVLNLSDSGLRSLPSRSIHAIVAKLPNVEFVDLSMNQLKSANLTLSGRVTFLNFSQNQLTRFQLQSSQTGGGTSNTTLAYLDLSHNNLTGAVEKEVLLLDADCANLTLLDMSHNHLVDLMFLRQRNRSKAAELDEQATAVEGARPFRVLNFAYNRLQSIKRDTFSGTPHLEILSLAHNLVSEIENDTFAGLQHLQYLDLGGNLLNVSSIRALQGIPDLIGLSLARNPQLGDALQGFVASWSLKELDISATGLCEIPAALAQSVRTLNLAHNHFQVRRKRKFRPSQGGYSTFYKKLMAMAKGFSRSLSFPSLSFTSSCFYLQCPLCHSLGLLVGSFSQLTTNLGK